MNLGRLKTAAGVFAVASLFGMIATLIGFSRGRNTAAERGSLTAASRDTLRLAGELASRERSPAQLSRLLRDWRTPLSAGERIVALVPDAGATRPYLRRYRELTPPSPTEPVAALAKADYDTAEQTRGSGHGSAELVDAPGGPLVRASALAGPVVVITERLPAVRPAALPLGAVVAWLGICGLLALAVTPWLSARAASWLAGAAAAGATAGVSWSLGDALTSPEAATPRVFGVVGAALALAVGAVHSRGSLKRLAATLKEHNVAYLYLFPAAVAMLLLVGIPFFVGLGLGFFDHAHGTYQFVGIANFVDILSGSGHPFGDPLNFWFTLGVTILWTFVNVLLHITIGLGLALVLSRPNLRFRGIYRVLLVLPWAVPNYITALIWRGMFQQHYGAVNSLLSAVGLAKVSWFSSFSRAFTANVITNTWLGFPFMMVVSMGALASIPREIYEAAEVDGAPRTAQFFRITLPLLRPALFPAVILGSIWTFNMFNVIYLVSEGKPGGSTDILVSEAYRWAFERGDRYGMAAAYAALIFLVLAAYSFIVNRGSRRRDAEGAAA